MVGVKRWFGQPYFLELLQEETSARAIIATIGATRRNFENNCIRYLIMNSKKLV